MESPQRSQSRTGVLLVGRMQGSTMSNNTFVSGPTPNTIRAADERVLTAPNSWVLLPPSDAALTRRVKAAGDHWVVAEKKGRKVVSKACGHRRRSSSGFVPTSTPSE